MFQGGRWECQGKIWMAKQAVQAYLYLIWFNLLHAKLEDPTPNLEILSCLRVSWGFVIIGAKAAGITRVFVRERRLILGALNKGKRHVVIYKSVFLSVQTWGCCVWAGHSTFSNLCIPDFSKPSRYGTNPGSSPHGSVGWWLTDPKASQSFWDQVGLPMKAERTFAPLI